MPALSLSDLQRRVQGLNGLPSLPVVLMPVLNQLNADVDAVDLHRTVELVARDGALAAQVLHMANSPLFGMPKRVTSLRAAALALGVQRLKDIVASCCLMQISPRRAGVNAAALWEHSFACAMVSRNLARKLGYPDPERAYLAGLIHDLGIIVNMILVPREFAQVYKDAVASLRPLGDIETEELGFSHELSGELLSEHWQLSEYLSEVMRCHHHVEQAKVDPMLAALINIADLLCRTSFLGYGYTENISVNIQEEPAWKIISASSPHVHALDMVCFTLEVEAHVNEVRNLVSFLFTGG
jgi:HD-like signal output (HDOD) protein